MSQSHNGSERLVNEQGLVDVWFFLFLPAMNYAVIEVANN